MASIQRPRVFLDVQIDGEAAGRLVIELFADKTPKTCENFRQLCTGEHDGLSYAKTPFHRVIDEFMIQGGDIANGDGTGLLSIYGEAFDDENLDWRELDAAGLVCSANSGKNTNGSQFFITLEPQPHLNGKHTIFGRLVSGQDVLQRISNTAVDDDDRPVAPVLISRCGELERRKKQQELASPAKMQRTSSHDRGRKRLDNDEDHEMDLPPMTAMRPRRQSDNVIDEGLRGRPRKRSETRRNSEVIEEGSDSHSDDPHSPVKLHKRKRSASPSRQSESVSSRERDYERRRPSLPNQYNRRQDRHSHRDDRYQPIQSNYVRARYRDDRRHHDRYETDRYRPQYRAHDRYERHDRRDGDTSGSGGQVREEQGVKFKGRGVMKYREPGRL